MNTTTETLGHFELNPNGQTTFKRTARKIQSKPTAKPAAKPKATAKTTAKKVVKTEAKAEAKTEAKTEGAKELKVDIDPRMARRKLRKAKISGHDFRDRWTFAVGSNAYKAAIAVLTPKDDEAEEA